MEFTKLRTRSADETKNFGRELARYLLRHSGGLVLLSGPLGAGKTTLTQGIAEALEVATHVTSPTFITCQEYTGILPLIHIDAWRLAEDAFFAAELEEKLTQMGIIVVEWPGQCAFPMPVDYVQVEIAYDFTVEGDVREVSLLGAGRFKDVHKEMSGLALGD